MIKVCHITSAHPKEDVRIFHKECVSLVREGYDVTLVQQGEDGEKNGVHIAGFGNIASNRIKRILLTSKQAYKKACSVNADIYHIHDPELLPYALKLKRKGKKVIFDSHEHTAEAVFEKEWLPSFIRKMVFEIYSAYQKRICKKLDAVVTVTPNIVNYFKAFQENTVQIANYPIFEEGINNISSKKKVQVAFAGGISSQWNHHIFLKALERIPQCKYCLCGSCSETYFESLKQLKGWKQVEFLGKIPHKEVATHLEESMIGLALLSPGRNTDWQNGTIGNTKIFEEMMAGLPVICTDFVLWKEFVERYKCGICIDPKNINQIENAVRYLIDNPEIAKQMGENGRKAIKKEFNWGVEEKKLYELYRRVMTKI